ncbi:membrane protein [Sphaerisporangium melleum]|uniref:Membrane protein n=1 Tax=Sphaerisporangium melleum TaxID=321316 RepID=A0A917RCW3_9ACTN|nr:EI24 domain-containing protein [Sphaerisporangium melleum]GGL00221.1 membrane protein [Sphaerisporangium melleum]GII71244.1 membrane protein [Sphaerisporangium melleum]
MNSIGQPIRRGVGGFADGIKYFLQGVAWVARHPRQWLFGLVPALIALVLYVVALVLLGGYAGDIAAWATPFADDWGPALRDTLRFLLGIAVFALGLVLSVVTFTAATLAIGEPFYEKLSERVEDDMGGVEKAADVPLWRSIIRSVRDSLITLGYVLMFTVPLFILGFVPVIGQTVVPVLGAAVSGFFLTVELTALAMERRGLGRRQRFAALRADRSPALGFGVLVFLVFLIPFGAVVAMPAAVAGATIMVRTRLPAGPASSPPGR